MPFVCARAAAAAVLLLLPAAPAGAAVSAESIRKSPTLRLAGGPSEIALPLEVVNFLLDQPETAAWFARERGIARYSVERMGASEHAADDHRGARGVVRLLQRSDLARLYHGEGDYESGVFPTIRAGGLLALSLSTSAASGCPESTTIGYEISVRMNSRLLSGLARPVVPFLRGKIRQKFERVFMATRKIGVLLGEDPSGAAAQLASSPKLSPAAKAELQRLLKRLPPRPQRCR